MNCSNCGTPLAPGARFCPSCGTPVPQAAPQADGVTQLLDPNEVPAAPAAPQIPTAYAAPSAGAPSGGYVQPKKTNRSLLMYILLSIVTCGIYGYIFIYNLANDANDVCNGDGEKTGGLLAFILLSAITCGIYSIIWWYKLCNRLAANAPRYGLNFQENGTTFLLWTLLGSLLCGLGPFIALNFVLRNMNALCAAYNQYNGLSGQNA